MKLYSKRQLAIGIVVGAIGAGALMFGGAFLIARSGLFQTKAPAQPGSAAMTGNSESGAAAAAALPPGYAQTVQYTIDENENIGVYERNNESVVNITTEVGQRQLVHGAGAAERRIGVGLDHRYPRLRPHQLPRRERRLQALRQHRRRQAA